MNVIDLALNIPHMVKGLVKGGKSLINSGSSIKNFFKKGPMIIGDFKDGASKYIDELVDGIGNIMSPKREYAGIGQISEKDINNLSKVDIKPIIKNDIQNNYNRIVNEGKGIEGVSKPKIDYNLVKDYVRDVESRTGIKLSKNQVEEIKNALRNKEYTKLTTKETAKYRNEFNKVKNNLIEQWESNTGQKWSRYTEDVISPNTGKVVRKAGDKYDAHHIIENSFGGEHEWWNIHPAKFPNEHQSGIHGAGSPANELFKGGSK